MMSSSSSPATDAAAASTHSAPTHPPHLLHASSLHRHLRTNNYALVRQCLSDHPGNSGGAGSGSGSGSSSSSSSSLLVANRIGWTALHFAAASHGAAHLGQTEQVNEEAVIVEDGDVGGGGAGGMAMASATIMVLLVDSKTPLISLALCRMMATRTTMRITTEEMIWSMPKTMKNKKRKMRKYQKEVGGVGCCCELSRLPICR